MAHFTIHNILIDFEEVDPPDMETNLLQDNLPSSCYA